MHHIDVSESDSKLASVVRCPDLPQPRSLHRKTVSHMLSTKRGNISPVGVETACTGLPGLASQPLPRLPLSALPPNVVPHHANLSVATKLNCSSGSGGSTRRSRPSTPTGGTAALRLHASDAASVCTDAHIPARPPLGAPHRRLANAFAGRRSLYIATGGIGSPTAAVDDCLEVTAATTSSWASDDDRASTLTSCSILSPNTFDGDSGGGGVIEAGTPVLPLSPQPARCKLEDFTASPPPPQPFSAAAAAASVLIDPLQHCSELLRSDAFSPFSDDGISDIDEVDSDFDGDVVMRDPAAAAAPCAVAAPAPRRAKRCCDEDNTDDDDVFGNINLSCGHRVGLREWREIVATSLSEPLCIMCPVQACAAQPEDVQAVTTPDEFEQYCNASLRCLITPPSQRMHDGTASENVAMFSQPRYVQCPNPACAMIIEVMAEPPSHLVPAVYSKPPARNPDTPGVSGVSRAKSRLVQWMARRFHKSGHRSKHSNDNNAAPLSPLEVDRDGKPLSEEGRFHRDLHRMRCAGCEQDFCMACSIAPYHIGSTCSQYAEWTRAAKCRYCKAAVAGSCASPECRDKHALSCKKVHECGHGCGGIAGEKKCLPCMECPPPPPPTKPSSSAAMGGAGAGDDVLMTSSSCSSPTAPSLWCDGSEYCPVCYVEALNDAPCIQLTCGHVIHAACAKAKVAQGWSGTRITFAFLGCPTCAQPMQHPHLEPELSKMLALEKSVRDMALKRLEHEGLLTSAELTQPHSEYYNKPGEFAMKTLSYYECHKCKSPYYGARAQCGVAPSSDAETLICGSCAAQKNDGSACKKHGREYMEFKCKFCCNIAMWFCWGNTHFCDKCHTRQMNGEYLNLKPVPDLPKCVGRHCPLKGKHPRNGQEFPLGCRLCRDAQAF